MRTLGGPPAVCSVPQPVMKQFFPAAGPGTARGKHAVLTYLSFKIMNLLTLIVIPEHNLTYKHLRKFSRRTKYSLTSPLKYFKVFFCIMFHTESCC